MHITNQLFLFIPYMSHTTHGKPTKCIRYYSSFAGFLKKCLHPDEDQLIQIGKEVVLNPKKIKTWFYNNKTKTKNQVGNEKKQSADRRVILRSQDRSPKVTNIEDVKYQGKRAMEEIKGEFNQLLWFNLLIVVTNAVLCLCSWLARESGFRTKIID
ncbi:hypothetical protein R3W88_022657 [Solanum pinnatisectum]|uniref:Homeobox domain-containing protein n=1 Tax=Solanum pinnatisectum TaxID=50273 RepID=A0AAV9LV77_9SOLN|nr:hypothetical protein R3W88_022657 [Solanum pinnatisectum]